MTQRVPKWRTVWITGASSGIGRSLALLMARNGIAVAASARSKDKLEELTALEPTIKAYPLDVTDHDSVMKVAADIKRDHGEIDLAILNAGIYKNQRADLAFSAADCARTMAVNNIGVASGVEAVLADMVARDRGHIAIVASVAGFFGLPRGSSYSPSKAATISLAELLVNDLAETKVKISVINPGFVDTPLTEKNNFPMPFIISPDEAATKILKGLEREKFDITFPWKMRWLMKSIRAMPYWMSFRIMKPMIINQRAQILLSEQERKAAVDNVASED